MTIHHELIRKATHTLLAVLLSFMGLMVPPTVMIFISVVLIVLFALGRSLPYLRMFHTVSRASFGEFYFAFGVGVSAFLFLPEYKVAWLVGMLVLAFADSLAALVGRRWGRHQYRFFEELRSIEGTVACACAVCGIFFLAGYSILACGVAGVLLAAVEAVAPRGSDNVLLPVIGGLLAISLV